MSDELMLKLLVFGSMAVMLLIPTVICFALYIRCITKKNRCTIPIRAKCIDIKSATFHKKHPGGGWSRNAHTSYCPVFTATINNKEITYKAKYYKQYLSIDVGDYIDAMVNPNNISEWFIEEDKDNRIGFLLLSCLFFTMAVGIVILGIKA